MTSHIEPVPEGRRQFLTWLTTGAITGITVGALYPYVASFVPPVPVRGGGGGVTARDRNGKDILASQLLATVPAGARVLSQGLPVKGGPVTYIVIDENHQIANFGLNAICPHLGCVVPWEEGIQRFRCPCHGSTYDPEGGLLRGPSPFPLALVKAEVRDNKILFTPWTGKDFRKTSLYSDPDPWWV